MCTCLKQLTSLVAFLFAFTLVNAQNPIVLENAKPGNPSTEWMISGAGDLSIQGFATDFSVNKGNTVRFKIKTNASSYSVKIYRLGWYNGDGARFIANATITASLPQIQPDPITNITTGLVDCGNWSESARWDIPDEAVSGIYIARLKRNDTNGASHIVFVVRDDESNSDLIFQTSDATWHAYNVYGGNSLYTGATSLPAGHASHVSYNRPFLNRIGGGGGGPGADYLFNAEYPMLRFLERNGYDVSYMANVDAAREGSLIQNHKVFLSVGHDEYWSKEQRDAVEAARNAGVHLAFFSGNEVYWKTRWENSADGSNTPFRTLVCYKEGILGENVCGGKCDPSPEWTGLWRGGCSYPGGNACLPENGLTGQISWHNSTTTLEVPSDYSALRFWRHTSVASLSPGNTAVMPNGTLGHEWNWEQYPDSYPNGRITMSSTTRDGHTHKLSLYRHSSGALVFGAGTIQWAWGLDDFHDGIGGGTSQDMQQATVNLLADMGVQPETLMDELTEVHESTDITPPVSNITSPVDGLSIPAFPNPVISGTASDVGGAVGGVEVSVDGGVTWRAAEGTTNWTFTWTPTTMGATVVKVRAIDDSGNIGAGSSTINLNIQDPQCPCTIFQPTDEPAVENHTPGGIEVGMKFRASFDGYIWGLRFYKMPNDVGPHVATIWTLDGNIVARLTFKNETASGWQQTMFGSPVSIQGNTTYVVSYHSPSGYYAETDPFFILGPVVNGPLTAIAKTDPDGPNGVYLPTSTPSFPTFNYSSENYWLDVVYHTLDGPDEVPPSVFAHTPANGATGINVNANITVQFDEPMDPASINSSNFELRDGSNNLIACNVTYDDVTNTAVINPNTMLNFLSPYSVTVKGGLSGATDTTGNIFEADSTWTFTTSQEQLVPPNQAPGGPILVLHNPSNGFGMYTAEILRAEGLNEYAFMDIATATATPTLLDNYDVIILGEMALSGPQVTMLSDWTNAGGTLIAMRPDGGIASLFGLNAPSGTLSDAYIKVDPVGAGAGIVNETMQYHGPASLYTLNGATAIATLYSDATTATSNPAVTVMPVGSNGGSAVAFAYDLAKSVVYTRQGNPAWIGQNRDRNISIPPDTLRIRSNDLFYGNADYDPQPDWIDFNKIQIPQADEQQRLLVNLILQENMDKKPLPRFWFLPSGHKAAVVMTGDDHQAQGTPFNGGSKAQFDYFLSQGPNTPTDVLDWKAIRSTSYIYPGVMQPADVSFYQSQGFEISLHANTSCLNLNAGDFENYLSTQLNMLPANYPDIIAPVTHRTHCVMWIDWVTVPKIQRLYGIRADANYYYWPGPWVQNRPGWFTGSGYPMRFADLDGTFVDSYQFATQISDEAQINYDLHINTLLDNAIGPLGYYGVVTTNIHTDSAVHSGMTSVITSAKARNIPVVSAKQMLTWIDGRNNSSFTNIAWTDFELSFNVYQSTFARNLKGMVPYKVGDSVLVELTRDGSTVNFNVEMIKGMEYAFFDANSGNYVARYGMATTATLKGQVTLQGRVAPPSATLVVPVVVEFYQNGNPTPVLTYNLATSTNSEFEVANIPSGTYTITVKNPHTLKRVTIDNVLFNGTNAVNFGTLREGDANDDNFIDVIDFSILLSTYNKASGDPGYDARADFNGDGFVDVVDFSLLLSNYNQSGENP